MTYVGLLEADLQGSIDYKSGGIGPLFQDARTEEPIDLDEFLSRVIKACHKIGVRSAVSLFVDDQEIYSDPDAGEEDNLDAVLRNARDAGISGGTSFYLMLAGEDKEMSHVITVEASVDHPADEAALSVLDLARFIDGSDADDDEGDEEDDADDSDNVDADNDDASGGDEAIDDSLPDITFDERDGEALVETFMQKVLSALQKELALDDPEIETWTDWDGEYDPDRFLSSALPGGLGL
jgi:hypothetical protein